MKRYEETLHQFQKDFERAQDNHRNSTLQVNDFSCHCSWAVSRTIADHSNAFRSLADWKPREKCAEPKSTVSWCPWQPQRSNGSGKLLDTKERFTRHPFNSCKSLCSLASWFHRVLSRSFIVCMAFSGLQFHYLSFLAGATFQELSKYQNGVSDNKTTEPCHGRAGTCALLLEVRKKKTIL